MGSSLETERLLLYFADAGKIEDHHFPGGREMVEVDRFVLLSRISLYIRRGMLNSNREHYTEETEMSPLFLESYEISK